MDEIRGKTNQASGVLIDDQTQNLKSHMQEAVGKVKWTGEDKSQNIFRDINEVIEDFKRKNN